MPLSFSASESRRIVSKYESLIGDFDDSLAKAEGYSADVARAAQKLIARDAYERLREVPLTALREYVPRLRVKNLEEYGYHTLADIYAAPVLAVAAVKGISKDGAYAAKGAASRLAQNMSVGAKVRLSADDVTPESTALIMALACHIRALPELENAHAADDQDKRAEAHRIAKMLTERSGVFSRLFSFGKKRRDLEEAFQELTSMVTGDWGTGLARACLSLRAIDALNGDEAWADFKENPIRFTNAFETLAPDLVGSADTSFGLPEDLAREVYDECYFPDGLLCELRNYQVWGVKYILHQGRVLLGDEMGLGKTVQAIATMVSLKNVKVTHFLVVCPASVMSNWTREVRRHSKLSVTELYGPNRQSAVNSWGRTGGVAVTTYETLSRIDISSEIQIGFVVVDEAHYIKNSETRRGAAVREICARSERVLLMTGTPIENNVGEMEALIDVLRPEIAMQLSTMDSLPSAPRFRQAIAPVYYRRKREDVLTELPDLIDTQEWCSMGEAERKVYEGFVRGKKFSAMRQVSWNAEKIEDSCKARRLKELVEMAESEGRKVIVFSFFRDTVDCVMRALGSRALSAITGSTPVAKRQGILDEFGKAPAGKVLVAQIQAGGTGLNIQSASVVIICEPQIKPSLESQAIARSYRMGQSRNVLVYHLLCETSVDERIVEYLEKKQEVFDAFADESEAANHDIEVDKKSQDAIIQEEIDRIDKKGGAREENSGQSVNVGDGGSEIVQAGSRGVKHDRAAGASNGPGQRGISSSPRARGLSVTQRAAKVIQPRGGYLSLKDFECDELQGLLPLHDAGKETVDPGRIGTVVDYMTRYLEGAPVEEAFRISLLGAAIVGKSYECLSLLELISGTDDDSITVALNVVGYDAAYRAGATSFTGGDIIPSAYTLENIREMLRRSQLFFSEYGPVVASGLTFEGGYTEIVRAGDGDFVTKDTLWDFKTSLKPPSSRDRLQLLMYWRLGVHSGKPEYGGIRNIGFFNPRLGKVYTLAVEKIPPSVVEEIDKKVLGY